MRFLLVIRQAGGGCDYTIACGVGAYEFQAKSIEEAQVYVIKQLADLGMLESVECGEAHRESMYTKLVILDERSEVNLEFINIEEGVRAATRIAAQRVDNDAKERAQYERLKAKFNK